MPAYQPYRENEPRPEGHALSAMLAGRTLYGENPQDQVRDAQAGQAKDDGGLLWHIMRMMGHRSTP